MRVLIVGLMLALTVMVAARMASHSERESPATLDPVVEEVHEMHVECCSAIDEAWATLPPARAEAEVGRLLEEHRRELLDLYRRHGRKFPGER